MIAEIGEDICPIGVLIKKGEGTHRGNVRVLLRDPRGRIGVKVGAAELLEEGSEGEWHSNIGDTVDFLYGAIN